MKCPVCDREIGGDRFDLMEHVRQEHPAVYATAQAKMPTLVAMNTR